MIVLALFLCVFFLSSACSQQLYHPGNGLKQATHLMNDGARLERRSDHLSYITPPSDPHKRVKITQQTHGKGPKPKPEKPPKSAVAVRETLVYHPFNYTFDYQRPTNATPNCTETDFKFGRWIPGAKHCGLAASYKTPISDSSMAPGAEFNLPTPYPFSDWCWLPHFCIHEVFSVEAFCRKLRGRIVYFVGDSLQYEWYVATMKQLEADSNYQKTSEVPNLQSDLGVVCANSSEYPSARIVYSCHDHIAVDGDLTPWDFIPAPDTPQRTCNRDWKVLAERFDILVLNKGAHFEPAEQSNPKTNATAHFLASYLAKDSNRRVYYRTTTLGHNYPSINAHPVVDLLLTEPQWRQGPLHVTLPSDKYHWNTFPRMSQETVSILSSVLLPRFQSQYKVLHVAEMAALRPDGHRCYSSHGGERCDGLHHFLPSVVDTQLFVLFNFLD